MSASLTYVSYSHIASGNSGIAMLGQRQISSFVYRPLSLTARNATRRRPVSGDRDLPRGSRRSPDLSSLQRPSLPWIRRAVRGLPHMLGLWGRAGHAALARSQILRRITRLTSLPTVYGTPQDPEFSRHAWQSEASALPASRRIARVAMILSIAALLAGCKREAAVKVEDARPVKVAVVEAGHPGHALSYSGVVRPRIESALGFRLPRNVLARSVNVGDRLGGGQVIARLDGTDLILAEAAARAAA